MSIWTIEAPSKMKIVLWRMAHDCLPTGQQLLHRHIPANDQCVFCGQTERVEYLFLLCPFARTVWAAVKERFPLQLRRNCLVSAKQWIFDYLARENAVNATVLAVVCWHIWEARNDTRNNEGRLHPLRVAAKIIPYVDMIMRHCYKDKPAIRCDSRSYAPSWIPPREGFVCMNVDAALFPDDHRMGWGAVLRDHNGAFILSVSEGLPGFPTPELAEGFAIRALYQFSESVGSRNVSSNRIACQ
jgi:hypothetical protein